MKRRRKRILAELERATWQVASVTQKEKRRFAPPPFHHFKAAAGRI